MIANIINGLSFGTILFILASGLTVSLGLMGYFNLAHGSLFVTAGYVGYIILGWTGNILEALVAAGIVAGLIGFVMERGFLRFLPGQIDNQVLLTIGVLFILENLDLWIFGTHPRSPFVPKIISFAIPFFGNDVPIYRFIIIGIGIAMYAGLLLFYKTRLGIIIRAGMDDGQMVKGMGLNLAKVQIGVFAAASALAGVAAMLAAPLIGLDKSMDWNILTFALIITVVGGAGSLAGAFLLAWIIGLVTAFGKILFPEISLFILYFIMVITLVIKPTGLLGKKDV
jgi:branched-chain amino acid transport system permease protein